MFASKPYASTVLILSAVIAGVWTNFGVIPAIFPDVPTSSNNHQCQLTDFAAQACGTRGFQLTYWLRLDINGTSIVCFKDTGCQHNGSLAPRNLACIITLKGTRGAQLPCLELFEVAQSKRRSARMIGSMINCCIITPILGCAQIALVIVIVKGARRIHAHFHPVPVAPAAKNGLIVPAGV